MLLHRIWTIVELHAFLTDGVNKKNVVGEHLYVRSRTREKDFLRPYVLVVRDTA